MSLWRALREGIAAATRIRATLVLFFVVYLVTALVLTLPVAAALSSWVGHRLAANDMARDFDGLLLIEPMLNSSAMLQAGQITPGAQAEGRAATSTLLAMGATVLVAGPLGVLLNVVLGGGVLLTYVEGRFAWQRFLWGAWHWMFSFLILAVLLGVCEALIVTLGAGILVALAAAHASALTIPALALMLLVFMALAMAFEYARITAVVEGTRNIFRALGHAVAFAVRQPGRALGLYLLMTALGLVLIPLYSSLIAPLIPFSWGAPAIALQQLYIVARLWTRLARWASQMALYRQGIGA